MKVILRAVLAVLLAVGLLAAGFLFVLKDEQKKLFLESSPYMFAVSVLLILPIFIVNGIEQAVLFRRVSNLKLDALDTLTLPLVANLWGYLIPFQGALLYLVIHIRHKYKRPVIQTFDIYLCSFSISLAVGGLVALLYAFTHGVFLFGCISTVIFLNPLLIIIGAEVITRVKKIFPKLKWLLSVETFFNTYRNSIRDYRILSFLTFTNTASSFFNALCLYWIAHSLHLHIDFLQLFILSLLLKITLILKLTPGNLGVIQYASGGIMALLGADLSEGFLVSSYQALSYLTVAFTLGVVFFLFNIKYFSMKEFFGSLSKKNGTG